MDRRRSMSVGGNGEGSGLTGEGRRKSSWKGGESEFLQESQGKLRTEFFSASESDEYREGTNLANFDKGGFSLS
jgi:hypothetical protein